MSRPLPFRRVLKKPTTLLCIDDQAQYLPVRKAVLESYGFAVITASSGQEGLQKLRKHKVDGVVLDYHMPEMDGGDVASQIRRRWPEMPIVLLSGFPYELPPRVRELVNAVVMKGGGSSELFRQLERVLPAVTLKPRPATASEQSIQRTKKQVNSIRQAVDQHKRALSRRRR